MCVWRVEHVCEGGGVVGCVCVWMGVCVCGWCRVCVCGWAWMCVEGVGCVCGG